MHGVLVMYMFLDTYRILHRSPDSHVRILAFDQLSEVATVPCRGQLCEVLSQGLAYLQELPDCAHFKVA